MGDAAPLSAHTAVRENDPGSIWEAFGGRGANMKTQMTRSAAPLLGGITCHRETLEHAAE